MVCLLVHSTSRAVQLEGPQEIVGFLEVSTNSDDFMDEVFDTDDVLATQGSLDDLVVGDGDSLMIDLGISSLHDQLPDALQIWVPKKSTMKDKTLVVHTHLIF